MKGYLALIRKDSITDMHGLARDVSLENSADSYICFRLDLRHSVSHFFFLNLSPSSLLYTVFDSISPNIDKFS